LKIALGAPLHIPPDKYRSERRKDQLLAVARLLFLATLLFKSSQPLDPLAAWNMALLSVFHVRAWDFPCLYQKTPKQRAPPA